MIDAMTIGLLLAQAGLAVVGIGLLRRRVWPMVELLGEPASGRSGWVLDVWAPLVVVIPLLVVGARTSPAVVSRQWIVVAGPIAAGWLAVAACFVVGAACARDDRPASWWWGPATASAAGVILLLLAAANQMDILTGQCAFAIAAVLLWMNTPPLVHDPPASSARAIGRAGLGLLLAMIAALGQGGLHLMMDGPAATISAGLMMGYVVVAVTTAAAIAGSMSAARVGCWSAAYGVLLGLGTLSLARVIPSAVQLLLGNDQPPADRIVANGFADLAPEACTLILLGPVALWSTTLTGPKRRVLGAAILVVCAAVIGWRLA